MHAAVEATECEGQREPAEEAFERDPHGRVQVDRVRVDEDEAVHGHRDGIGRVRGRKAVLERGATGHGDASERRRQGSRQTEQILDKAGHDHAQSQEMHEAASPDSSNYPGSRLQAFRPAKRQPMSRDA